MFGISSKSSFLVLMQSINARRYFDGKATIYVLRSGNVVVSDDLSHILNLSVETLPSTLENLLLLPVVPEIKNTQNVNTDW